MVSSSHHQEPSLLCSSSCPPAILSPTCKHQVLRRYQWHRDWGLARCKLYQKSWERLWEKQPVSLSHVFSLLWQYQQSNTTNKPAQNTTAHSSHSCQNSTAPQTTKPMMDTLGNTERSWKQCWFILHRLSQHRIAAHGSAQAGCAYSGCIRCASSRLRCAVTQLWLLLTTPSRAFELTSNSLWAICFHHQQPSACWCRYLIDQASFMVTIYCK